MLFKGLGVEGIHKVGLERGVAGIHSFDVEQLRVDVEGVKGALFLVKACLKTTENTKATYIADSVGQGGIAERAREVERDECYRRALQVVRVVHGLGSLAVASPH